MVVKRGHTHMLFWRAVTAVVVTYALVIGGTFNGILSVPLQFISLILSTIGMGTWIAISLHRPISSGLTPLGPALIVWAAAYTISAAAHPSARVFIGVWYAGFYTVLWFILSDMRQRGFPGHWITDGLLFAIIPLILLAVVQVFPWFWDWIHLKRVTVSFAPSRPSSLLGNPNALGTILAMGIPFGLARALSARRTTDRVLFGFWTLSAAGTLYLTYSRGAWMAAAAGLSVFAAVHLLQTKQKLVRWWYASSRRKQRAFILAGIIILVSTGALIAGSLKAFDTPRRSTDFRVAFYELAWQKFRTHPLTGTGPFTFGLSILQNESIPPGQPHAHAHNLILNLAAEMGIPGVLALLVTVVTIIRRMQASSSGYTMACGAALTAFGVHGLFDVTMMMPSIMLVMLGVLAAGLVHPAEKPIPNPRRIPYLLPMLLGILVLGAGWGSTLNYANYVYGERLLIAEDYSAGAKRLGSVVQRQPFMAFYQAQYGYALGLAAYHGDKSALEPGIAAYQRALELEAPQAIWWTNLAALYQQNNQPRQAVEALMQAIRYAPDDPDIRLNLGAVYEQQGKRDLAAQAYERALYIQPMWGHSSFWATTSLRREVRAQFLIEPSPLMQAEALWQTGHQQDALAVLEQTIDHDPAQPRPYFSIARLYIAAGELEHAQDYLDAARILAHNEEDMAWIYLTEAELARARGDQAGYERNLHEARALVWPDNTGSLVFYARDIANFQFLRLTIKGTFLPQVITLRPDPALVDLLR